LAAACEDRHLRLETKKSQVSELSERLSASKHDLSKAVEIERECSASVAHAEKNEKACSVEKKATEATLKTFEALESRGAPSRMAEAKKMLREIEKEMDVVNMKTILFPRVVNAVIPALQLKPESRSSFEDGALAAAEGCFTNFIREKGEELSSLSRETAAVRKSQQDASEEVKEIRREIEVGVENLRGARESQKECDVAFKEAIRQRKEHKEKVAMLVRLAKEQARLYSDFVKMTNVFEALSGT
jgi:chromosome segregation ATPase